jgi:phosphotransferase family enzyme
MAEAQPSSDIYGMVLDRGTLKVLMLEEKGGWTLPHVHIPDKRVWPAMVGVSRGALQKLLAADVTVLRRVDATYSADRSHVDLIYELENHSPHWTPPPQATCIDRAALQTLSLTHPDQRAIIEAELEAMSANQISGLRPAWAQPGWFKSASDWMRDQLTQQGFVLTGSVEQVKSWGISCLLKVATGQGDIYFKVASSLPLFGNEPKVQQAIAQRFPDYVPAPIAIEPQQRWMLMEDLGADLRDMPTLERWETAVVRFGRLQIEAASAVEDLLAAGCLDRRLSILAQQIDPSLNNVQLAGLLPADEMSQLRALVPHLKTLCRELADYRVPYSLNHGDLHSGNISWGKLLFFDWTDACIAHPFLDLSTVVNDVEDSLPGNRERVVDAYLNVWADFEPLDRLRALWRLAEPVGALHQAISYQHILAALEPASRPEMSDGVTYWLRRIIKTMPE